MNEESLTGTPATNSFMKYIKWYVLGITLCATVLGVGFGSWRYFGLTKELEEAKAKGIGVIQMTAKDRQQALLSQVGKLMVLPTGETPTIAQVDNATTLRSQPFFANAENADWVIVFTLAKKAILYRASINKIIEVMPVSLTSSPGASSSARIAR